MRIRKPVTLDRIAIAATAAFIRYGYGRARIHQVAESAGVGPGTIYLYAEDKEALFELALLRALESPLVAQPALPYRKTETAELRKVIDSSLHQIAQFPQLWVAAQRRDVGPDGLEEYHGILLELIAWLRRYRSAVLLAERNRLDWPELAELFQRNIWSDLHRRLTTHLGVRMRAGQLAALGDPSTVARFTVDALVAFLVTGPLGDAAGSLPGGDDFLADLAASPVESSRHRLPFPSQPR